MRFNTFLLIVAFFSIVVSFQLNKDNHRYRGEITKLKKSTDSLNYEITIQNELINRYEIAIKTLEKEDPTIPMRWDLLQNGITIKR